MTVFFAGVPAAIAALISAVLLIADAARTVIAVGNGSEAEPSMFVTVSVGLLSVGLASPEMFTVSTIVCGSWTSDRTTVKV